VSADDIDSRSATFLRKNDVEPSINREADRLVSVDSEVEPVLSVVMPTMNEESGIGECIDQIESAVERLSVPTEIIVSDSSTDRTPEIARERGAIVVEPDRPGYGYAYRYAFERVRGRYVVMGDADTTYDFSQIPRLLGHLVETDADIVMGSRLEGEISPGAMPPLHKHFGNPLLTKFLNVFYDAGVSDAHSGFRIFTRDALEVMDLETSGMEFASEIIMEAGAKDLVIEEVPIVYHEREGDETLESFRDGWRHVRFMLLNAPGYLFSVPGLILSLLGLLVMGTVTADIALAGIEPGVHSMIAGSLLLIVGYQIGSLGVFSAVGSDTIRRPNDVVTNWILTHGTVERGAMLGFGMLVIGIGYASALLLQWYTAGFGSLSFTHRSLVAFTAIVLGVQTIFSAFFLDVIDR